VEQEDGDDEEEMEEDANDYRYTASK